MIVLGAGGDLAARLILPGLAGLFALGKLPDDFRLVGIDRTEWDGDGFRAHVLKAVTASGDATWFFRATARPQSLAQVYCFWVAHRPFAGIPTSA